MSTNKNFFSLNFKIKQHKTTTAAIWWRKKVSDSHPKIDQSNCPGCAHKYRATVSHPISSLWVANFSTETCELRPRCTCPLVRVLLIDVYRPESQLPKWPSMAWLENALATKTVGNFYVELVPYRTSPDRQPPHPTPHPTPAPSRGFRRLFLTIKHTHTPRVVGRGCHAVNI